MTADDPNFLCAQKAWLPFRSYGSVAAAFGVPMQAVPTVLVFGATREPVRRDHLFGTLYGITEGVVLYQDVGFHELACAGGLILRDPKEPYAYALRLFRITTGCDGMRLFRVPDGPTRTSHVVERIGAFGRTHRCMIPSRQGREIERLLEAHLPPSSR